MCTTAWKVILFHVGEKWPKILKSEKTLCCWYADTQGHGHLKGGKIRVCHCCCLAELLVIYCSSDWPIEQWMGWKGKEIGLFPRSVTLWLWRDPVISWAASLTGGSSLELGQGRREATRSLSPRCSHCGRKLLPSCVPPWEPVVLPKLRAGPPCT